MSRVEIKPATAAVIREWCGDREWTGRAVMAVEGDRVLGVGGVDQVHDILVAWLKLSDDLRRPFWIARHLEAVLSLARGRGLPVFAECDPLIRGSARLLRFAGFRPLTSMPALWLLQE